MILEFRIKNFHKIFQIAGILGMNNKRPNVLLFRFPQAGFDHRVAFPHGQVLFIYVSTMMENGKKHNYSRHFAKHFANQDTSAIFLHLKNQV